MHCSTSASFLLFCVFRADAALSGSEVHLLPVSSQSQRTAPTIPTSTDQGEQMKTAVDGMVESSRPTPVPLNAPPGGPDLGEQLKKAVDAMVESSRRGMQFGKDAVQSAWQKNWDHARDMAERSVQSYKETEKKTQDALKVLESTETLPEDWRARMQKYFRKEERKVSRSLDCARILHESIIRRKQPVEACLHLHPTPKPRQPAPATIPQHVPSRWPVSQSAPRQQREPAAAQNSAEPLQAQALFSVGSKDVVPTNRAWQHAVPVVFTTFGLVALFTAGLAVARHRRRSMAGRLEAHSELITETSLEAVE